MGRRDLLTAAASSGNGEIIARRDPSQPIRLSPDQLRIWFMEEMAPDEPVYNESDAVRLRGVLDVDLLERALNAVVVRHESLRTIFPIDRDEPVPIVLNSWRLPIKTINLRAEPPARRETALARLLVCEPREPYRMATEPPVRATLVRLGEADHALLVMMHHIICDYTSMGILWRRDLAELYRAGLRGEPVELSAPPLQYSDYAAWRALHSNSEAVKADLEVWRRTLNGAPELLDLPTDAPRPARFSYRGARRRFVILVEQSEALRRFGRRQRVSQFNVFAAAIYVLLYRYSGQSDILVGLPLSERDRPELQSVFGFFLHTHVLRLELSDDLPFPRPFGGGAKGGAGALRASLADIRPGSAGYEPRGARRAIRRSSKSC